MWIYHALCCTLILVVLLCLAYIRGGNLWPTYIRRSDVPVSVESGRYRGWDSEDINTPYGVHIRQGPGRAGPICTPIGAPRQSTCLYPKTTTYIGCRVQVGTARGGNFLTPLMDDTHDAKMMRTLDMTNLDCLSHLNDVEELRRRSDHPRLSLHVSEDEDGAE